MDMQWIGLVISLVLAWTGALLGVIRYLLASYHASLEARLAGLDALADREQSRALELERRLAQDFVRREDCVRCHMGQQERLGQLQESVDALLQQLLRRADRG